jgi:class 3 adenylate cyclase
VGDVVRCTKCKRDNPADAQFCQGCGLRLELICPACATSNSVDANFCKKCGAHLTADALSASASSEKLPARSQSSETVQLITQHSDAIEGERKTVTALFADIKGSMELMADLDPEEARAIVDPALKLMIDAAHRYDGYIVQSTGDGIFALFGAPVAHEDHPLRALYAALRMQEEMRRYAGRLRADKGINLQARVGLNTGEVVVRSIQTGDGHAEYTPIGHCTGLAARLQTLANPGAVVIGESVRRLAEGYFQLKPLGAARIKGVNDPVELFEVTGLGPLRTRLQAAARRGLTKFVGRQAELEQMRHALELARSGHGQIVAAIGDPGVGKSRLFYEFKAIAQSGCLVLEAYSVSHGKASAYLPVIDLLKSYFEIVNEDDERHSHILVQTGHAPSGGTLPNIPLEEVVQILWKRWDDRHFEQSRK